MATDKLESQKQHRRAVRREILLPFAGGVVLVVALVVIAASQGAIPVSGVANTMLTLLILCPLALCLLPIYLLLVLAVFGMNRAHGAIASPLLRLEKLIMNLRDRTYSLSDQAARKTINLSARFAPLDKMLFSLFDRPATDKENHE